MSSRKRLKIMHNSLKLYRKVSVQRQRLVYFIDINNMQLAVTLFYKINIQLQYIKGKKEIYSSIYNLIDLIAFYLFIVI